MPNSPVRLLATMMSELSAEESQLTDEIEVIGDEYLKAYISFLALYNDRRTRSSDLEFSEATGFERKISELTQKRAATRLRLSVLGNLNEKIGDQEIQKRLIEFINILSNLKSQ